MTSTGIEREFLQKRGEKGKEGYEMKKLEKNEGILMKVEKVVSSNRYYKENILQEKKGNVMREDGTCGKD